MYSEHNTDGGIDMSKWLDRLCKENEEKYGIGPRTLDEHKAASTETVEQEARRLESTRRTYAAK